MKKDKLYTVNKWNQPMFGDKNLFYPGGEMNSYGWTPSQMEPISSLAYKPLTIPTIPGFNPQDLIGTPKPQEPLKLTLSDSTIKDVNAQIQKGMQQPKPKKGLSDGTKMAMGVAGSAVGDFLSNIISDGYSAGTGFNTAMSTVRNINTGDPLIDGIKNVATTAIQAIGNRGWGVKENKENIAAIKQNTAQAKAAGNALASSTTSSDFFNNSGQMVGSLGFGWKDLYKNGMFTNKGKKMGNALVDENTQALAMQRQGEVIGANNVDSYMDDDVMSNFKAAFGGPINTENNNSMGALEYGLMSDFLNTKQRQAENKNNMGNLFAGMPRSMFALGGDIEEPQDNTRVSKPLVLPIRREHNFSDSDYFWNAGFEYPAGLWKHKDGTFHTKGSYGKDIVFTQEEADKIVTEKLKKERANRIKKSILSNKKALGGDIQTNGADFTTGMTHVNAGGSHEENPNEGIQMGVDPQGTPNLVEENETVYNDYVYSNRIFADGGTLKKFHLPKKAKLTYADITKKLEKEIKERPNDPISQAAFKAQMEDLANEQERQKQEMEAERAREAFEALSPEEQVEVMQYAQQQEQAQQEAAMQEQAMAEQQAAVQQQPSPEEMAMMQQQMQGQPMIGEGYAYGGNLFALGGDDDNILISRPAGYSFGYTPSNGVVPASAAYKRVAEVSTENRQATPKMFKGKPLPRRKGMADSSYAKEMEKAGFNDLEIDEYILGADGNNHSFTYSPRTKTFKAKKWRKSSGEPLYSKAEIDAEQKSFASGAKRANSVKGNQPQAAPKQAPKSTSTTSKSAQTAKTQVQDTTTASPRTSIFSSVSNAVDRAYADAQAKAKTQAQTAPATTTSTTTNSDPFGVEARARKFQELRNSSRAAASESSAVEEAPVAEATPRRAVALSNTDVQADRGTERNVGDWKNPNENHWDLYTKPGFESYIDNAIARYNMAGSDEDKRAIQDEVMNAVNGLQQSYNDVIAPNLGASKYSYRPEVESHQTKFENLGGNRGFWPTQEDGSTVNVIGNAINLPLGYSTGDNPSGRGIDGYEGPQTALRHFGSTADGDATYFAPLVDKIRSGLNLNYSPNTSWSYGKDGQYQLYGLSRIEAPVTDDSASPTGLLNAPAAPDANGNTSVPGRYGNMPWAPENAKPTDNGTPAATPAATTPASTPTTDEYDVAPVLKAEWPRYVGLAAPIVGLGMQIAGVGKPDKSGLDYYLDLYNKHGAAMADYMPIGDYHRYTPMDVWASLNRMDANARAADRITMNSSLPLTTKYALTMGNNYTNQIAHGETYRQGLEYNDNKSLQAAQFNKDTNKFNAEAYNRAALQNAEAMNRQRQYSAQLGMQAAAQKADMDSGWYNGIYGNVAGLFKGISDLGKENAQHNMIAKMAADGIFGNMSDKQFTGQGFLKRVPKYTASEGGKIGKKKGKRGLTI